ncbi:MAG: hypothetical protein AAF585_17045 [Verrucomicrobiota bacterium]
MRAHLMVWVLLGSFNFSAAAEEIDLGELEFLERRMKGRTFMFLFQNDATFKIETRTHEGKKSALFEIGDRIENRFQIKALGKRQVHLDIVPELTILDGLTGKIFKVARKQETRWPDYFAEFRFGEEVFHVQEGRNLQLPKQDVLVVLEVNENDVVMVDPGDEKRMIRLQKKDQKG